MLKLTEEQGNDYKYVLGRLKEGQFISKENINPAILDEISTTYCECAENADCIFFVEDI